MPCSRSELVDCDTLTSEARSVSILLRSRFKAAMARDTTPQELHKPCSKAEALKAPGRSQPGKHWGLCDPFPHFASNIVLMLPPNVVLLIEQSEDDYSILWPVFERSDCCKGLHQATEGLSLSKDCLRNATCIHSWVRSRVFTAAAHSCEQQSKAPEHRQPVALKCHLASCAHGNIGSRTSE